MRTDLCFLFVLASAFFTQAAVAAPPSGDVLPKVKAKKVAVQDLHRELLFPARVTSQVQTEIFADFEGVVTAIRKNVGAKLGRNETVLVVRNTDPIYRYAPVKILTPVAGVLSSLVVTEGTQVKRGQLLATLTDPNKLRIEIEIPAMDLDYIRPLGKGVFESSALVKPAEVKILGVSPSVNAATGTAPAILVFNCKDCGVRPGLLGQVRLTTYERKGIRIPENSISYRDGQPIVKLVEGGIAKFRPVKLGEKTRGDVEILDGLKGSEELILRSNVLVKEGVKVDVEKSEVDPSGKEGAETYGPPAPAPASASTGEKSGQKT